MIRDVPDTVKEAIRQLPKGELHAHVDGCCSRGVWDKRVGAQHDPVFHGGTLQQFLDQYYVNQDLLRDKHVETLEVMHSMIDQAANDGVRYIEPGLSAGFLTDEVVSHLKELQDYARSKGVAVGFMAMAHRRHPPDKVREMMQRALELKEQGAPIVSLGCSGNGNNTTLREWGQIWDELGGRGKLKIVPHAGEVNDGSDAFQDLWDAIAIAPDRVAHGVQAMKDPRLLEYMRDTQTCCDVAVTSNELIANVKPGEHVLPQMVRAGIPCSINTDDALLFGCTLTSEYEKAYALGMSLTELAQCARSSIIHSGASAKDKDRILREIDAWSDQHVHADPDTFDETEWISRMYTQIDTSNGPDMEWVYDQGSKTGGGVGTNQYGLRNKSVRAGMRQRAKPK